MPNVNLFDVSLVLVLAVFVGIGVWRGFVRELISLITWIVACLTAWTFSDRVAPWFESLITEQPLRQLVGFIIIFVAVFITGSVIGLLLHKVVTRNATFRNVNRVPGGVV